MKDERGPNSVSRRRRLFFKAVGNVAWVATVASPLAACGGPENEGTTPVVTPAVTVPSNAPHTIPGVVGEVSPTPKPTVTVTVTAKPHESAKPKPEPSPTHMMLIPTLDKFLEADATACPKGGEPPCYMIARKQPKIYEDPAEDLAKNIINAAPGQQYLSWAETSDFGAPGDPVSLICYIKKGQPIYNIDDDKPSTVWYKIWVPGEERRGVGEGHHADVIGYVPEADFPEDHVEAGLKLCT